MAVSADALRTHIDYTAWASAKLVAAACPLPAEHLTHDFGTSDRHIVGTLAHIFAADRLWLARLLGNAPTQLITDADRSLPVLQSDWPAVLEGWKEWARGITDERVAAAFTYQDMKGNSWTQPLWQIVLHVVNHGTHHRGQVSGFMRALGHTPPATDLVYYYRESR